MNVTSYVINENDALESEQLFQAFTTLPADCTLQVVNLTGTESIGVPSEVLQVMMLKKTQTFPLMVIDGKPAVSGKLPTEKELYQFLVEGIKAPALLGKRAESVVDFPTKSRIYISMDVRNIEESVKFYQVFFGQEPTKVRDDYAKFEVEEPPLELTLHRFHTPGKGGPILHLGVQVKSNEAILEAMERFTQAGFNVMDELDYAGQTKIWVADPDGNRWEVQVVMESSTDERCSHDCVCLQELQPSCANA